MFKYIKRFLYRRGYLKFKNLKNKIEYLLLIDNYDFYKMKNINIKSIENNILLYTNILKEYNQNNIREVNLNTKDISIPRLDNIGVHEWFSNNGYFIENQKEYIVDWLENVLILYDNYLLAKKEHDNKYCRHNSFRLQPYIINIELIVDAIINLKNNE